MAKQNIDTAGWLRANDPTYGQRTRVKNRRPSQEKSQGTAAVRRKRLGLNVAEPQFETIRDFVEAQRHSTSHDCIFVPAAVSGRPAQVTFCGKTIAASRYMTLLTHGTPKSEGMIHRHLCGNGHLSCVNPNHLAWGTHGDNQADANKHRRAGENVQDRIHTID